VNPKSTSNQSSKPCTVLLYPSRYVTCLGHMTRTSAHIHMHIHMCVYVCACAHICVYLCVYVSVHASIEREHLVAKTLYSALVAKTL